MLLRHSPFQYPQADRDGRNSQAARATAPRRCFSILKRIETVGTDACNAGSCVGQEFQYPQADRDGRNCCWAGRCGHRVEVFQYPQADRDGRNAENQLAQQLGRRFSILKRIETVGTGIGSARAEGIRRGFSILKRIETVGTGQCAIVVVIPWCFSILKRIETVGTANAATNSASSACFSILKRIETVGTRLSRCDTAQRHGFSILKRIETVGTSKWTHARGARPWFQYPQADRDGRNSMVARRARDCSPFQYPQADRDGRNCPSPRISTKSPGFSILKRIETVGTTAMEDSAREASGFQYPQADRDGRNRNPGRAAEPRGSCFSILKRIETVGT